MVTGTETGRLRAGILVATASALTLFAGAAAARDWVFTPRVGASATYTTNVRSVNDELADADTILAVMPGFTLEHETTRSVVDVNYQLQALFFTQTDGADQTFHQLAAGAHNQFTDIFSLDVSANYFQTIVSPEFILGVGNFTPSGNRSNVLTAQVSPRLEYQFGPAGSMFVDYTYGVVDYQDKVPANPFVASSPLRRLSDNTLNRVEAGIGSGGPESTSPFSWGLNYTNQFVDYGMETDPDNMLVAVPEFRYERLAANVGFALGSRFRLVGSGGQESDVRGDRARGELNSDYWEAGFDWQLSSRDQVEARFGQRFFGDTWRFLYSHTTARLDMGVSVAEDVSSSGLGLLNRRPVILPSDLNPGEEILDRTSEIFVVQRIQGHVSLTGHRTTISFVVFDSSREYNEGSETEGESGAFLSWRYQAGQYTAFNSTLSARRFDFRDTPMLPDRGTDTVWSLGIGVDRAFSPTLTGSASVSYLTRSSDNLFADNTTVGMLKLTIVKTF